MNEIASKTKRLSKQVGLLGLVILAGSGYFLIDHIMIVSNRTRTTATVIKVRESYRHGNETRTYTPTVRYKTRTGKTITASTSYASSVYDFDTGDKITVYYNEKEPSDFYITVFSTTWGLPIFGVLCGCLILWSARKL